MKTYVLYHANCWDGFCAAWIARSVLQGDVEFIPVQYGEPKPEMGIGSIVYILDFSYPRSAMRLLLSCMHKIVVLDHHKSAKEALDGLVDEFIQRPDLISNPLASELPIVHFDMDKSGGHLAWEHFYESRLYITKEPRSRPWLVDYTEDRDLWRHKLDWSREINAFIRSWPLDFAKWDEFDRIGPGCERWDTWVDAGSAILRREQQIIDDHLKHAREIEMDGHKVLAVNATVLFSDIAGELAKDRPFGVAYWVGDDKMYHYSLRSREGGIDVSDVARSFGGGGHAKAAGFTSSSPPWSCNSRT